MGTRCTFRIPPMVLSGFPGGSEGEESACNVGDLGSILGQKDSLEKGILQYSRLGNSMVRGVGRAIVPGVAKSWTQLS